MFIQIFKNTVDEFFVSWVQANYLETQNKMILFRMKVSNSQEKIIKSIPMLDLGATYNIEFLFHKIL